MHTPRERLSGTGNEEISRQEPHMSAGTPVYCWGEVLQRRGEGGAKESEGRERAGQRRVNTDSHTMDANRSNFDQKLS